MSNTITQLNRNKGKQTVTDQKQVLAQKAILKSIEVRTQLGFALNSPICIYDLYDKLKVKVRFVDINMEGMYIKGEESTILLSSLRPLSRRNFTCAHELGHHIFEHGSTVDELQEGLDDFKTFSSDEFLVDTFAGFLFMPPLAVRKAFVSRGWNSASATPLQFFTIACSFGVGYETLIKHMTYTLRMISHSQASSLLKSSPKAIRRDILRQTSTDPLIIADLQWSLSILDAEVGGNLLLPSMAESAKDTITIQEELPLGRLFRANRPGLVRVYCPNSNWAIFVRISRYQFVGLSKYRHLEDAENE
jgi:Zn-dependent peptidase ImmA (M78 family)